MGAPGAMREEILSRTTVNPSEAIECQLVLDGIAEARR